MLDTVFWIASFTKLMTSIAALQCVERGSISLHDDFAKVLPELARLETLSHFSQSGESVLVQRRQAITLR